MGGVFPIWRKIQRTFGRSLEKIYTWILGAKLVRRVESSEMVNLKTRWIYTRCTSTYLNLEDFATNPKSQAMEISLGIWGEMRGFAAAGFDRFSYTTVP